ncbi:MAG: 3'(2'),5'-bisphosphate nucleotidase CysQ [Planctomycetes bacterium]|nr:3'(2'),5'-bisphosphate nucleotidase CysQ [Planctomycetota bacterium]
MNTDRRADLTRITDALVRAGTVLRDLWERNLRVQFKQGDDPVTEADHAADALLKEILPQGDDGWLSEETVDDPAQRLGRRRVWIVDPLDGTREYVDKIPEWCVSIGLVEDGAPVAGGIHNPVTKQIVVGAVGHGVTLNGAPASVRPRSSLKGARVLASNSEVARGEWDGFADEPFEVVSVGSVAYKLGLVAAGLCDATWTFTPKHEWDVAGGAALVLAAGGMVYNLDGSPARFNGSKPRLPGFVAFSGGSRAVFEPWFARHWRR